VDLERKEKNGLDVGVMNRKGAQASSLFLGTFHSQKGGRGWKVRFSEVFKRQDMKRLKGSVKGEARSLAKSGNKPMLDGGKGSGSDGGSSKKKRREKFPPLLIRLQKRAGHT